MRFVPWRWRIRDKSNCAGNHTLMKQWCWLLIECHTAELEFTLRKLETTVGRRIWMYMILTLTQWRLAVYFEYWISQTGGDNSKYWTLSTLISPMRHRTYSLPHYIVPELWKVFLLVEMRSAGGSQTSVAGIFAKKLLYDRLLDSI